MDLAIRILAPRLSKQVRRRMNPIGVATFSVVAIVLLPISYLVWYWAISSANPWVWGLAITVSSLSLGFLAAGISVLSKVEGEEKDNVAK